MYSTLSKTKIIIWSDFILSFANAFNLDQCRILSFGKELKSENSVVKSLSRNVKGMLMLQSPFPKIRRSGKTVWKNTAMLLANISHLCPQRFLVWKLKVVIKVVWLQVELPKSKDTNNFFKIKLGLGTDLIYVSVKFFSSRPIDSISITSQGF